MASIMLKKKIVKFLEDGKKTTTEILCHLNDTSRHGTTMNQLGNILSKTTDIKKIGMARIGKPMSPGSHENAVWAIADKTEHVDYTT